MSRNLNTTFRGQKLLHSGFVEEGIRVVTSSPDTMTDSDNIVAVNLTVAGAVAITLPSTVGVGTRHRIYDQKGDAGTNNITISPPAGVTIEGASSLVINVNNGCVDLILESSSNWKILSRSFTSGASADLTSVSGNLGFSKESAHSVSIAASTTAATAGGALSLAAGAGNTTGAGGAISVTGGAGGNDAVGGAASLTGGAAGGGNRNGGAVNINGGAKAGSGTDGAINIGTTRGAINIGLAGSLIGMNGVTAAAIPTPAGYTTLQTAGGSGILYADTKTTGGVGSTQFTFGDLIASLKTNGFIKQ